VVINKPASLAIAMIR